MQPGEPSGDARFARRVLILLGIGLAFLLAYVLRELLLLVFGSVVVAVLLATVVDLIQRIIPLKRGLALALAVLLVAGVLGGAGVLFRFQVWTQMQQLVDQLPDAWDQAQAMLAQWGIDLPDIDLQGLSADPDVPGPGQEAVADGDREPPHGGSDILELGQGLAGQIGTLLRSVFGALANTLLVVAGGIYFAAQPQLYRTGLLALFPKKKRPLMSDALGETVKAIKLWLVGTLFSMALIGAVTAAGLWLLGVPSPAALGLLAGLLEFVPIIGPIAASIPAILIAFTQGIELALWTTVLFIVIQQLESNLVQPVVQKYAVDLPPALLLFSVVAGGYLFGIIGILFAAPITVAAYVLVRRLYVVEALDTPLDDITGS